MALFRGKIGAKGRFCSPAWPIYAAIAGALFLSLVAVVLPSSTLAPVPEGDSSTPSLYHGARLFKGCLVVLGLTLVAIAVLFRMADAPTGGAIRPLQTDYCYDRQ